MIQREMTSLMAALNQESWEWLLTEQPLLAAALSDEVGRGATPEEVGRFVMRYAKRPALAQRLEQAAGYLRGQPSP